MHNIVLTTGDVARHCGVNFRTVIRWIEKGYLPAYRLPGRGDNRIKLPDFLAFLHEYGMPVPLEFQELRRRVLVVDDDASIAQMVVMALERHGFACQHAHNGFDAGIMMGTFEPAVMVLDLSMPGIDGFGVIERVRGNPRTATCRILVLSARPAADLERAVAVGADEAMAKPFEVQALLDGVARLSGVDLEESLAATRGD